MYSWKIRKPNVFIATSVKSINLRKYLQCINHGSSGLKPKEFLVRDTGVPDIRLATNQIPHEPRFSSVETIRISIFSGRDHCLAVYSGVNFILRSRSRARCNTRAYRSCTATLLCPSLCLCRSLFTRRGPVRADERESLSRSNERLTARWCIGSDLHWRRPRGNQPASLLALRLDTSPPQGPAKTSREGRELTALPLPAA